MAAFPGSGMRRTAQAAVARSKALETGGFRPGSGLGDDLLRFGRYLFQIGFDGEPVGVNDIGRLRRELEDRGMQFLDNRAVQLGETGVYLVGIEDLMEGRPDLPGKSGGSAPGRAHGAAVTQPGHYRGCGSRPRGPDSGRSHARRANRAAADWPDLIRRRNSLSRSEASGYSRRGRTQVYVHRGLGESASRSDSARRRMSPLSGCCRRGSHSGGD